jgi:hypothetical protein
MARRRPRSMETRRACGPDTLNVTKGSDHYRAGRSDLGYLIVGTVASRPGELAWSILFDSAQDTGLADDWCSLAQRVDVRSAH